MVERYQKSLGKRKETINRHLNMVCKTFAVKIQENSLNKQQKEALERIFLEQKWYKNYIINWCNQSKENKLSQFDTKQTYITKKDKDMNDVNIQILYLSAQSRQCLKQKILSNLKTIKSLKLKNLQKGGWLKYSKKETSIELNQYGVSHKIISNKRIKITGIKKPFVVNGLNQFINVNGVEYANAKLIKRSSGYYIQFVCFFPKENKTHIKETIGVDFGCETSFTLSNGVKLQAQVQESDRLKRLQRKLQKKAKGSKNWCRCKLQLNKEYEKLTNKKNNLSNKIVHELLKYETIVIQDEQLSIWHKSGHGKKVQHSILGKVKTKLKAKPNVVVLHKYTPTTKLCTNCGYLHNKIRVWNRIFKCSCGVKLDRDIHAAQNMVWFYKHKIGTEHTEYKRVEMHNMIKDAVKCSDQKVSKKHEIVTKQ